MQKPRKRVVVVGMGFGGIEAARALAGKDVDVLVLDRRNFHLFQPLLYQVATAMLDQETVAAPIRAIVRAWPNVRFQMTEVQGINLQARQVQTPDGAIHYDYLIVAAGSVTNFFGNENIGRNAFDLKQLHDAVALRNHILSVYERATKESDEAARRALLTFVIVGGGPTGVEFAGSLAELTQHVLARDFPELNGAQSRIILVESSDHILSPFPRKLRHYAVRRLEKMGVTVRLKSRVTGVESGRVLLQDGAIPAQTLFWAAGVRAAPLADVMDAPKVRGGRVSVQPDLSLQAHPEVFVVGDMAHLEQDGAPLPMLAPVAMQQGEHAARVIVAREEGNAAPPFRYFDRGTMAVIGRYSAVAMTKGVTFRGFSAWLAWLGLHLYFLIGFRNRIAALINWGYSILLFDKQVRLITRDSKAQGDDVSAVALGAVPSGAHATSDPQKSAAAQATAVVKAAGSAEVTADSGANQSAASTAAAHDVAAAGEALTGEAFAAAPAADSMQPAPATT